MGEEATLLPLRYINEPDILGSLLQNSTFDTGYSKERLESFCLRNHVFYNPSNTKVHLKRGLLTVLSSGGLSFKHKQKATHLVADIDAETRHKKESDRYHQACRKRKRKMAHYHSKQTSYGSGNTVIQNFGNFHNGRTDDLGAGENVAAEAGAAEQNSNYQEAEYSQQSRAAAGSSQSYASTGACGGDGDDDMDYVEAPPKKYRSRNPGGGSLGSPKSCSTVDRRESEAASRTLEGHASTPFALELSKLVSGCRQTLQGSPRGQAVHQAAAARRAMARAREEYEASRGCPEAEPLKQHYKRLERLWEVAQRQADDARGAKENRLVSGEVGDNLQEQPYASSVPSVVVPELASARQMSFLMEKNNTDRTKPANESLLRLEERFQKIVTAFSERNRPPQAAKPPGTEVVTEPFSLEAHHGAGVKPFEPAAESLTASTAKARSAPIDSSAPLPTEHSLGKKETPAADVKTTRKTALRLRTGAVLFLRKSPSSFDAPNKSANQPVHERVPEKGEQTEWAAGEKRRSHGPQSQSPNAQHGSLFRGRFSSSQGLWIDPEDKNESDSDKENLAELGDLWKQEQPRSGADKRIETPLSAQAVNEAAHKKEVMTGRAQGRHVESTANEEKLGAQDGEKQKAQGEALKTQLALNSSCFLPNQTPATMIEEIGSAPDEEQGKSQSGQYDSVKTTRQLIDSRGKLEALCKQHHLPVPSDMDADMIYTLLESGTLTPSELLRKVEAQIAAAEVEAKSRKSLNARAASFLDVAGKANWLADYEKDPLRHSHARGVHKLRLEAEKARKDIRKRPEMAKKLDRQVTTWEEMHQRPFYYDSLMFRELLTEYTHKNESQSYKEGTYVQKAQGSRQIVLTKAKIQTVLPDSVVKLSTIHGKSPTMSSEQTAHHTLIEGDHLSHEQSKKEVAKEGLKEMTAPFKKAADSAHIDRSKQEENQVHTERGRAARQVHEVPTFLTESGTFPDVIKTRNADVMPKDDNEADIIAAARSLLQLTQDTMSDSFTEAGHNDEVVTSKDTAEGDEEKGANQLELVPGGAASVLLAPPGSITEEESAKDEKTRDLWHENPAFDIENFDDFDPLE